MIVGISHLRARGFQSGKQQCPGGGMGRTWPPDRTKVLNDKNHSFNFRNLAVEARMLLGTCLCSPCPPKTPQRDAGSPTRSLALTAQRLHKEKRSRLLSHGQSTLGRALDHRVRETGT